MKIEMFEKIGEVTIAELKPASENKKIANEIFKQKQEELRIIKEKEEKEKQRIGMKILAHLTEEINKIANDGRTSFEINWTIKNPTNKEINWRDWMKASDDYVIPILESAGYCIRTHWYSDSWTRRSGKIGYIYVSWSS